MTSSHTPLYLIQDNLTQAASHFIETLSITCGLSLYESFVKIYVTAQDVSRELLYSAEAQLSDQLT
jgi:hypothetical protein